MDTAGNVLKTEREKQGKSLEEIVQRLKLNIEYLRAIEKDNYSVIPAEIYTKAYLRFYAQALGLDSDHIIELYQKQMQVPPVQKPAPPKEKVTFLYKPVLKIASIILFFVLIIILIKYRERQPVMENVRETKPPRISETTETAKIEETQEQIKGPEVAGTEKPEVKEEAQGEKEPETKIPEQKTPALQERKEVSVLILAADTTWISVRIDGSGPKEWLLKQGEKIALSASERFVIKTGNAGSTKIIFNGEDLGKLGGQGKVLELTLPENVNGKEGIDKP
jgi:cytoskeletal protein RodZ